MLAATPSSLDWHRRLRNRMLHVMLFAVVASSTSPPCRITCCACLDITVRRCQLLQLLRVASVYRLFVSHAIWLAPGNAFVFVCEHVRKHSYCAWSKLHTSVKKEYDAVAGANADAKRRHTGELSPGRTAVAAVLVVSSPNAWASGPPATGKPSKVSSPSALSTKVAEALCGGSASTTVSNRWA